LARRARFFPASNAEVGELPVDPLNLVTELIVGHVGVLGRDSRPLDEHAEVLAEVDQGGELVGELEADPLDLAADLAATVEVTIDDYHLNGRGPVPVEPGEVDDAAAVLGRVYIVERVGNADRGKLGKDGLLRDREPGDRLRDGLCLDPGDLVL